MENDRKIIFFDGDCYLCNSFVQFVIHKCPSGNFYFSPLQGEIGKKILPKYVPNFMQIEQNMETIYFWDGKNIYDKSSAIIKILSFFSFPWRLLSVCWIIPKPIRDFFYTKISKNRYKWFGKNSCMIPNELTNNSFIK